MGLLTDDGLPARLAHDLDDGTTWHVEQETQSLPLDEKRHIRDRGADQHLALAGAAGYGCSPG
ncbi:hypothetical protein [Amycolatopsis methanolica]|uniref:Uncharacterized protein n=1 Tax=Amycolatopsis methanolica 239 TaxID=1068978 RepID=A0A076MT21_AMYME|nr:hypothetical protein [Amycolatopsis methanolica]AIJ21925.1 hypothetical protein AMETH_1833 [Amycolatopsis methanolica 239]